MQKYCLSCIERQTFWYAGQTSLLRSLVHDCREKKGSIKPGDRRVHVTPDAIFYSHGFSVRMMPENEQLSIRKLLDRGKNIGPK